MKSFSILFAFASLLLCPSCWAQDAKHQISVNIPSVEQEATSIWRTINDIVFFEKQGYRIHLPEHDLIDSLITKSKQGNFGNEDFPLIYNLLESGVYSKDNYNLALEKVKAQEDLLNSFLQQLSTSKTSWDWAFKMFESYPVVFTLYGTGGSYDPNQGTVTLFTSKQGDFMNYKKPANTIIHEIVHIGIEHSIVQKCKLSHGSKERLVDTIVYLLFQKSLPEYEIQNMGNTKLDELLKTANDLKALDAIVQEL